MEQRTSRYDKKVLANAKRSLAMGAAPKAVAVKYSLPKQKVYALAKQAKVMGVKNPQKIKRAKRKTSPITAYGIERRDAYSRIKEYLMESNLERYKDFLLIMNG